MAKIVTTQLNTLRVAFASTERITFACLVSSVDDSTVYAFSKHVIALERIRASKLKGVELLSALTDEYRFEGVPHVLEYVPRMIGLMDLAILALTKPSPESLYPVEDLIQALADTPEALEIVFLHATSDHVIEILSKHLSTEACMRLASEIHGTTSRDGLKKFKALISREDIAYDLLMDHFEQHLLPEKSPNNDYAEFLFERLAALDKQALITWLLQQLQDKEQSLQVRTYAFIRLISDTLRDLSRMEDTFQSVVKIQENPLELRRNIAKRCSVLGAGNWTDDLTYVPPGE